MGAAKRIDIYFDVVSYYSFVAFEDVLQNLSALTANHVHVEFHPVFLSGIMQGSGNRPPWMLEAKAKYIEYDRLRAQDRVGIKPEVSFPPDFLNRARSPSQLRALYVIKANFPLSTFLATVRTMFFTFWTRGSIDMTEDGNLRQVLLDATEEPDGSGRKLFTEKEVDAIMRGRGEMKDALKDATAKALELGAFGAPWIWATNAKGEGQPFFGSDRFGHIYRHLDIDFQDVKALPPRDAKL